MKRLIQSSSPEIDRVAAKWIARRDAGWTVAEQAECERWRAEDVRHAQALAKYEHAWDLFDRPRAAGGAETLWDELDARMQKRRRRRLRMTFAGAAVLVAVGLAVQVRQPWRVEAPPSAGTQAIVHTPEKRTLPDGSVVELRAGASIAVDFAGTLRRVALREGEAHFQVAPDAMRPFVVTAGGVDVRAVGTAFSVQLGTEAVEVLVTAGRIAVEGERIKGPTDQGTLMETRRHGDAETRRGAEAERSGISASSPAPAPAPSFSPSRRLSGAGGTQSLTPLYVDAGNRIQVKLASGESQTVAISETELAERLAWRAPRLEFSGTPLAEVVAILNQYSRVQLTFEPGLASIEMSGFFRADSSEAFLRVLEGTFGITAERSGDIVVLRAAR